MRTVELKIAYGIGKATWRRDGRMIVAQYEWR